jgi:hypothetical protein
VKRKTGMEKREGDDPKRGKKDALRKNRRKALYCGEGIRFIDSTQTGRPKFMICPTAPAAAIKPCC